MKTIAPALMVACIAAFASIANGEELLFPKIAETTNAAPETAELFDAFFTAKSRHDVDATMSFFSPQLLTYTDATVGWPLDGFDALKGVFASYMPNWGEGSSYPFRIIGGPDSAVVAFVDTPELFGGEIRPLGVVDFKDGKIVRWVDYWDSTGFPTDVYEKVKTPAASFPKDFREAEITANADPVIVSVATSVQQALASGDIAAALAYLASDVVYEDFALRTQVLGRSATARYVERVISEAPFGHGSTLMHIVGGRKGGGFEWRSSDGAVRGVTAIELGKDNLISRITTTYDARLIDEDVRKRLVALSADQ